MKKLVFLFTLLVCFSSCISIAPNYHRHPYRLYNRPVMKPGWEKKYEAPSRVYRNRNF